VADILDFRFIVAGLSLGSLYGLSGAGLVVLYRESGVLNLAYGAIGALVAFTSWDLLDRGWPEPLVWLIAILLGTVVSVLYGLLLAPRLAFRNTVERMIGTLGLALLLLGFVSWYWESRERRSLSLATDEWAVELFDVRVSATRMVAAALALAVTGGITYWLKRSKLGLHMRAVANDRELSSLLGVSVISVEVKAWAMTGAIAGLAGLLLGSLTQLDPAILTFLVIPSAAAAVVGRLSSLWMTLVGGLVIGLAESLATPIESLTRYRSAAPFIVAIVAILAMQRRRILKIYQDHAEVARSTIPAPVSGWRGVSRVQLALSVAALAAYAFLVPTALSTFWLSVLISASIFSIAAVGLAIPYGSLGLVSLAQVGLVAVGGWVTLRVGINDTIPFEVAVLIGGIGAAAFGVVVGLPALRMRGLYLALVTLMLAGAVQVLLTAGGFPNGGSGFWGRVSGGDEQPSLLERPGYASSDVAYFRLVVVVLGLALAVAAVHARMRPGRAWALIRTSDAAAFSAGVNVTLFKIWAFALAGFLAGIGGGLLAGVAGQLRIQTFPAAESILLFALVVASGPRLLAGAVVAGLLYRAVPARLTQWDLNADLALVVFGLALFHALVTAPDGIVGQLRQLVLAVVRRRPHVEPAK
jgi:branched-chain amino acid transport system permease protein